MNKPISLQDKILCNIDNHSSKRLLVSFYNKTAGSFSSINIQKSIKLASAEFKTPKSDTIESIFYSINSNNIGDRHGILDLYTDKKIIQLTKYKAHQDYVNDTNGIPKNIIRSFLPILKSLGYSSLIIMVNSQPHITSYENIGMQLINNTKFIVNMIDAIATLNKKNVLKSKTNRTKLKDTIIDQWLSSPDKNSSIIVGNIDSIRKKLDEENIGSATIFS